MQLERCSNCGAELVPGPDGRVGLCGYCHARGSGAVDPGALAASLGRDMSDIKAFVERLATTLEAGFSSIATVERSGFFSKHVSKIEIATSPMAYTLEIHGSHVTGHRSHSVHGISLKNETIPMEQWVAELSNALATLANESEAAKRALSRL